MSKIGKQPIEIPNNVKVTVEERVAKVEGPKGALLLIIPKEIELKLDDKNLLVLPVGKSKKTAALWGTIRAIMANMVIGVEKGFEKKLEIEGVGFKARMEKEDLILNIGFSHPVIFKAPKGVNISVEKNIITVSGISLELVGQAAANIRALKKPEPYKGKGIHYVGEIVRRKAGKKVAGTTG
ncbi:MAG: 50S ribosomal protein L6 [Candidatus Azambacteria bacterium]|nr:50S ribosomal protein L6 [Candidatus Azambacteria bacterium]